MAKHISSDKYTANAYEVIPNAHIHPDVEHHVHPEDTSHYILPAVFSSDKGFTVLVRYPGPGVYFITAGEAHCHDTKNGNDTVLTAGSVVHIEDGAVIRWRTKPGTKGFAAFYVPVSVKSFDEFVVPE
ncbi:hypothetical protein JR316_0011245 [Psilocybe cubensis]|uniref:Uncharacterized protein n=2 Tax=Psilocybe cubensis TaxID=181762 RepID=A0A8H7XWC9_PSICU|nr:hypothetical protein JR316_0011245 [Psilocybe cubensis]KAH9475686.1 hypothetical protein JR316_0011245 [Psilocybe cubensis]